MKSNGSETTAQIEDITERIAALEETTATLEQQLNDHEDADQQQTAFTDPDLMHKVVHACMNSEAISEDEELQILQTLLG